MGHILSIVDVGNVSSSPPLSSSSPLGTFILSVYMDSWLANVRLEDSLGLQYEIRPYFEEVIDGISTKDSMSSLMLVNTTQCYESKENDEDEHAARVAIVAEAMARSTVSSLESNGLSIGGRKRKIGEVRGLAGGSSYQPDNDDILDVGVLWTPQALVAAGGFDSMTNKINVAIDESNTILKNSDVNFRLRLASAHMVSDDSYEEPTTNAFPTMFFDLLDLTDGVFDEDTNVNRYNEGADVLVLLVADGSYCGVGAQINDDNNDGMGAHAVVALGCVTGIFSFLHEIGHMLGANHDFSAGKYVHVLLFVQAVVYVVLNPTFLFC